uniref:Specifically androgen-regulated gene protein-like n=1 Tax=Seriola lalandi dorsalis TaxID=1841481 RepID=A0A3B4X4N0_SERLL
MPKSDTWPGGVAMESLSNIDSAGSCDSVISMNSDSMEHLSAEERACLMYLEETIEALEVQEDSGLSNDEDSGLQAEEISRPKVDGIADHHAVNQTSEPQSFPVSAANTKGFISTPLSLTQPKPPDTESVPPSATRTRVLCISTDGDAKPKIVTSTELCSGQSTKASEINLGLIPPPSDFMDVPYPHAQPKKVQDHPPPAEISCNKPGATIDLEKLRQRASAKRTEGTPNMAPPEVPPTQSPPAITSGPQLSPPAVAPKPKKLPPNIILKSHKAAVAGSDGSSGHSVPASSDRVLMDPQRVRFEALRKLGLLKGDEADSGPALSPKLSPKTRRSWGAPPSPLNNELSAVKDVSEAEVDAQVNTPPFTPPTPTKQLMPFKIIGVKSATLERSGLGLSSYMASQDSSEAGKGVSGELSPSHLRNNRPRPASLGSRKEFSSAQGGALQPGHAKGQEPNSRRSMPAHTAFQHSGDSQKLPRSQGISVLICPRAENEEDRREALKKLGLLRD